MGDQRHALASFPPGKRPDTHCTGDWVGIRVGLDVCGKILPQMGFESLANQPVANLFYE